MRNLIVEEFERRFMPEPNSGCWLWERCVFTNGYGRCKMRRFGIVGKRAHRVAWELYRGPIPAGVCVLHRCDVPICVNPAHLFLGDRAANAADRDAKGRHGGAKLTEADVLAIRAADGGHVDVAQEYGVDISSIRRIRARKIWKHI